MRTSLFFLRGDVCCQQWVRRTQNSNAVAQTPYSYSWVDTNGLLLDVIWGGCLGSFQQLDNSPYTTEWSIWNHQPFSHSSPWSLIGLLWRPPAEGGLSSYLQAADRNFPAQRQTKSALSPRLQHGWSCACDPYRNADLMYLAPSCLDVMLSRICTVNLCSSQWGRCFGFPIVSKNSVRRSCILRSTTVGCAQSHSLNAARTDAGTHYKGAHCNGCHEY